MLYRYLPYFIFKPLFGDREKWGLKTDFYDADFIKWQNEYYLQELKRILKPNGILIGAVPTEGGIAWGLGRFVTSRRYVKKHMDIDYDKIICWEHPNFVNKIKKQLDDNFINIKSVKKPLGILPMDFNLSWSFIYRNDKP